MKLNITSFIQIAVFLVLCGSFFYIGIPALSLSFLMVIIGIFIAIKHKNILFRVDAYAFIIFLYLFILGLIAVCVFPSYENLQYLKSFFSILILFLFFLYSRNLNIDLFKSVEFFTLFIMFIAILQFSFLYFGFGLNPEIKSLEGYDVNLSTYGIRSIFSNSNDFSVILILLSVYFFMNKKISIFFMIGLFVFFAGSRTAMFLYFVLLLLFYVKGVSLKMILNLMSFLLIFLLMYFFYFKDNYEIYAIRRFLNIFNGLGGDSSINSRFSNIGVFFDNISLLYFGGWNAKNYSIYSDPVFYVNPHSFIIEILLLYGIYGFVLLIGVFIIISVYLSKVKIISNGDRIVFGLIFFILTFVPSSILNFPTFWALIFIILLNPNKKGHLNA